MQKVEDKVKFKVELLEQLSSFDLFSICDAAETTMNATSGFNIGSRKWPSPMKRDLEAYFNGLMLIQERKLIVGRIKVDIVGAIQLLLPHKSNKFSSFSVTLQDLFVIHGVRNTGIADAMIRFAEGYSISAGFKLMKLSVRSDMIEAASLVEKLGYKKWGVLDKYELVGTEILGGNFYYKDL